MSRPLFALIDCNNFFVSCEKLFRPNLEGRPVVVLSSNDGCAVARSNEAKALGIPMGAPAFKYRQLFKEQGVVQFSGNFELYGDISERITKLLTGITPHTEVYSVDEAFLDLGELRINDYQAWGRALQQRIWREIGIPVSIGLAASKTLAKLAAERAKKNPELQGVLDLLSLTAEERASYLAQTAVKDVWGVGWRLAPRLKAGGIFSALELANLRPRYAQALMGVHGRQMVAELNGIACHRLERFGKVRQSVMHGRLFGEDTNNKAVIEAAIASLTAVAAFRLRREGLLARTAIVSFSTNRHKPGYRRQRHAIELDTPTADTGRLTSLLVAALEQGFRSTIQYHRADVVLVNLVDQRRFQPDLFGRTNLRASQRAQARLQVVDALNSRYGRGTLHYAAEDLSRRWQPKHRLRSRRYTTDWQELPVARTLNNS